MAEQGQAPAEVLESERTRLLSQLDELGFGPNGSLTYDTNFADSSQVTAERGELERLPGRPPRVPGRRHRRPSARRRGHLRPVRALRQADLGGPARGDADRPALPR